MSRNVNRICIVTFAMAGLFCAAPIAAADPAGSTSPGVPCLEIAQEFAASPPDIQQPLQDAAAALVETPAAVPAVPDVASLGSLAPSQVSLPTVPGLPLQLPSELSMPHDLICEGTAWSASKPGAKTRPLGSTPANRRW